MQMCFLKPGVSKTQEAVAGCAELRLAYVWLGGVRRVARVQGELREAASCSLGNAGSLRGCQRPGGDRAHRAHSVVGQARRHQGLHVCHVLPHAHLCSGRCGPLRSFRWCCWNSQMRECWARGCSSWDSASWLAQGLSADNAGQVLTNPTAHVRRWHHALPWFSLILPPRGHNMHALNPASIPRQAHWLRHSCAGARRLGHFRLACIACAKQHALHNTSAYLAHALKQAWRRLQVAGRQAAVEHVVDQRVLRSCGGERSS